MIFDWIFGTSLRTPIGITQLARTYDKLTSNEVIEALTGLLNEEYKKAARKARGTSIIEKQLENLYTKYIDDVL